MPPQTDWLDSRYDLDSRGFRITAFLVVLFVALLIDLIALTTFGRRSPMPALLVVSLPQVLVIFVLQYSLFLPLFPPMCAIGAVWGSKTMLALFHRPWENHQLQRGIHISFWLLFLAILLLLITLPAKSDLTSTISIVILITASSSALILFKIRPSLCSAYKMNLFFWFSLCGIQISHWFWFRKICISFGIQTIALASLIPAIILIYLFIGSIRNPTWLRTSGKLVATVLLIVCIEFIIRSTPVESLLAFDWRTTNSFWDLRKHTNLIDCPKDAIFKDSNNALFSWKKPEGVFRIVCLGSSSTVGIGSENPNLESYPKQLGSYLERCAGGSVEVINAGIGGYNLTQLRIYFEHFISGLNPDLLIFYFGNNYDDPATLEYYKRVEALLKANPKLLYPREVEAALSLRWPHPILVRTYLIIARSRFFMGVKLFVDAVKSTTQKKTTGPDYENIFIESADLLVKAALREKIAILLIPEIAGMRDNNYTYESIFKELILNHAGDPIQFLRINGSELSKHLVAPQHMTSVGYGELARIISDHLISLGIFKCEPQ